MINEARALQPLDMKFFFPRISSTHRECAGLELNKKFFFSSIALNLLAEVNFNAICMMPSFRTTYLSASARVICAAAAASSHTEMEMNVNFYEYLVLVVHQMF